MIILKTYPNTFSSSPNLQTEEIYSCKIKEDIKNFSTAEVKLPVEYSWLSQYTTVELCEIEWFSDIPFFRWYIYSIVVDENEVSLVLRNEKALLQRKAIVNDVTYSSQTIGSMVNSILTQWNTPYSESWSSSVTASATTYTVSFKQGDNIYQALDTVCNLENLQWTSLWGVVTVKALLWEDKTTWPNYTEAVYSRNNPWESNISKLTLESTWTLSNIIIGTNGVSKNTQTDAPSIAQFWPLYEYVQFRDWQLATQTTEYLNKQKNDRRVWKMTPNVWELSANVGDKIVLRIEWFAQWFDTESQVNVIAKETTIKNSQKIETIQLSDNIIEIDTFTKKIQKIKDQTLLSSL